MKHRRAMLAILAIVIVWWVFRKNPTTGKTGLDAIKSIGQELTAQLKSGILAIDTQDKNAIAAQGKLISQWQSGIDMQFQDAIATWGDRQAYLTQLKIESPTQPGNRPRGTTTGPLYQ